MVHTLHVDFHLTDPQTLEDTVQSLYEKHCDTIEFRDGRYEVQLPWRTPRQDPPSNYELSLKKLKGLLRCLKHDPDVLPEYHSVVKTQLQQRIIESLEEPANVSGAHYFPHHPVIQRGKMTTKLRTVYEASAETIGPSLNNCLDPGLKFDQKILDILTRFRVAVTADIEKAFLMISVAKNEEFLRFLWVDNPAQNDPVITYWFTKVVFGVTAGLFLLNATVRHHLELHSKPMVIWSQSSYDQFMSMNCDGFTNRREGL